MTDPSTDHGSVVPAGAAALIVDASGEISLMLPKWPDGFEAPRMINWLVAVAMRSTDEDWVEEILEEFAKRRRS